MTFLLVHELAQLLSCDSQKDQLVKMARELTADEVEKAREAITVLGSLVNRSSQQSSSAGSAPTCNPSNQSRAHSSGGTRPSNDGETETDRTKSE